MAIVVDKVQKRNDIALACKDLFIEKGLEKLTIAEVAKTAGVGKGTIYDYFTNKEDIVFEIINTILIDINIQKTNNLNSVSSTRDKMKAFYDFFWEDKYKDIREIYKVFISISLGNPSLEMIEFNQKTCKFYFNWFQELLQDGIDTNQIIPESIDLAVGLYVMGDGILIKSLTTGNLLDVKQEIYNHIDTLFNIIEVKS